MLTEARKGHPVFHTNAAFLLSLKVSLSEAVARLSATSTKNFVVPIPHSAVLMGLHLVQWTSYVHTRI